MSTEQAPAVEAPLDDKQHAERIRDLIFQLSAAVNKAKDHGLTVHLSLEGLGLPVWKGYLDAAKITRIL